MIEDDDLMMDGTLPEIEPMDMDLGGDMDASSNLDMDGGLDMDLGGDDPDEGAGLGGMDFGGGDDGPKMSNTLDGRENTQLNQHRRAIFDLPVEVVFAVGRARPTVKELLQLSRDSLVTLDAKIDDPVEVIVGKRVIARGQLQEVEGESGRLAVRLTEIVETMEPF